MRAYGLRLSKSRTIAAQSSGRIISSLGTGFQSVIGVSTKPGLIAVARTPLSPSPRFNVFVNWITAAFAAPYTGRKGVPIVPAIDARLTRSEERRVGQEGSGGGET